MAELELLRAAEGDGSLPSYVWPGGYPMQYLTKDGLTVCPGCANENDTSDPVVDGDPYMEGPAVACDDCGDMMESAYGDPGVPDALVTATSADGAPVVLAEVRRVSL